MSTAYEIGRGVYLTSNHGVSDGKKIYKVANKIVQVLDRDISKDWAVLAESPKQFSLDFSQAWIGNEVYALVFREGNIVRLNGKVLDPSAQIAGYNSSGMITLIHNVVMTDIPFELGDSGAPIFNQQGDIVDIVHVQNF